MPLTVGVGALKLPQRWGGHRIPVRLHVLILVMPVLSSLLALVRAGGPAFALVFVSEGPLGVLMVLVHELGHIAEAVRHGCSPSHILLWPLGGLAVVATCGNSHRQFARIAVDPCARARRKVCAKFSVASSACCSCAVAAECWCRAHSP